MAGHTLGSGEDLFRQPRLGKKIFGQGRKVRLEELQRRGGHLSPWLNLGQLEHVPPDNPVPRLHKSLHDLAAMPVAQETLDLLRSKHTTGPW